VAEPADAHPDPYEVLGVAADASSGEIRSAYLTLARRHHPDVSAGAELEMTRVNEAWAVLGDPDRRRAHDQAAAVRRRSSYRPGVPTPGFAPYDDGDDPDDPAAEHDVPYGDGSVPHRSMQLGPVAVLAVGLFALATGLAMGFTPLLALGIVAVVAAGLLFVGTPFWVVMRSQRQAGDERR
jgi:hypothetical protein